MSATKTSKRPTYDPNQSFGFVMQDVARLMRRNCNRALQPLGLTYPQVQAMTRIYAEPGLNQARLADLLELQPISIARLIDRLQAAGWVERRKDPQDRRALMLYLTDKAEPMMAQVWTCAADMRAEAARGLSEDDKDQLLRILQKMRANLGAA